MRSIPCLIFLLAGLLVACPLVASAQIQPAKKTKVEGKYAKEQKDKSSSDIIELANGTKLVGKFIKEEQGKITFHADLIGVVVVESASVVMRDVKEPGAAKEAEAAVSIGRTHVIVSHGPEAPPPEGKEPATPSAEAAAVPQKAFWKRVLSINGSYNSAAYSQGPIKGAPEGFPTGAQAGLQGTQSTLQVTGMLIGATPYQSFTLSGSYGYANYQPAGTVLNNHAVEGTYTYVLSPKDYLLERTTYKVDVPSGIEHSFEQVVGFGHKFVATDRTDLDVIPGLSLLNATRGTEWDGKWILSAGFLEHLTYAFNERVSLEQRFKFRDSPAHATIWAIDSYLGIKAAITEHVSFTTGATFTYDNTLGRLPPPLVSAFLAQGIPLELIQEMMPAEKSQLEITSGLEYNW